MVTIHGGNNQFSIADLSVHTTSNTPTLFACKEQPFQNPIGILDHGCPINSTFCQPGISTSLNLGQPISLYDENTQNTHHG